MIKCKTIECKDCPYFWADCDDNGKPIENPHCQYQYNDGYAPCEIDDYETEDTDED